ncbi:hypothetical protein THAOC_08093 [Thalassiosira oceanica]|uniref:Uncharacterized protein n=1 Tax=Thalassiosira oceanica TaxID=159749 RepID=K0TAR8_THAOC|nr:hypothetical protein THAOC_08093 [Thalassiosira oceanica]|eukprot:EJK70536.1 hypothetical protein THAOC_08093 [Thalassiosira oceanica]
MYDVDTNVIYLCGKGDGNIRACEFEDKAPYFHKLNDGFRSTTPLKGVCFVPKRGLDIMKCETARLLKVTNENGVQPLSFHVPRKSDAFQSDIFPPTASANPAQTAEEWMKGGSKGPELISLNPNDANGSNGAKAGAKKFKSVSTLTAEVKKLEARVNADSLCGRFSRGALNVFCEKVDTNSLVEQVHLLISIPLDLSGWTICGPCSKEGEKMLHCLLRLLALRKEFQNTKPNNMINNDEH